MAQLPERVALKSGMSGSFEAEYSDMVLVWSRMYKVYGSSVFEETHHNRSYSKEFKEKVVREYLTGRGSFRDLAVEFERCFDRIDEDAAESIMKILNES